MKVVVEGKNIRAKKDERPATQIAGRNWQEINILLNGSPIKGFKAEPGHWLYFNPGDLEEPPTVNWHKLDTNGITIADPTVISFAPQVARKTEEEKKAARKARRLARKEKRKLAKASTEHAVSDREAEDLQKLEEKELRAMRRKAKKEAQAAVEIIEEVD